MANVEPLTSAICSLSSPLLFLNNEPPPRHYDLNRVEQNLSSTEFEEGNELLKFQKDYSNDFDLPLSMRKRKQKVIKLLQKRQKVRIDGIFRKIRVVDSICRVVENYDFDRTDLFPLGIVFNYINFYKSQIFKDSSHLTTNQALMIHFHLSMKPIQKIGFVQLMNTPKTD